MKGNVSLGEKIREFDFKFDLNFHQEFSEARGFLPVLRYDSRDSTTSASTT